jgi:hypothetical protein
MSITNLEILGVFEANEKKSIIKAIQEICNTQVAQKKPFLSQEAFRKLCSDISVGASKIKWIDESFALGRCINELVEDDFDLFYKSYISELTQQELAAGLSSSFLSNELNIEIIRIKAEIKDLREKLSIINKKREEEEKKKNNERYIAEKVPIILLALQNYESLDIIDKKAKTFWDIVNKIVDKEDLKAEIVKQVQLKMKLDSKVTFGILRKSDVTVDDFGILELKSKKYKEIFFSPEEGYRYINDFYNWIYCSADTIDTSQVLHSNDKQIDEWIMSSFPTFETTTSFDESYSFHYIECLRYMIKLINSSYFDRDEFIGKPFSESNKKNTPEIYRAGARKMNYHDQFCMFIAKIETKDQLTRGADFIEYIRSKNNRLAESRKKVLTDSNL